MEALACSSTRGTVSAAVGESAARRAGVGVTTPTQRRPPSPPPRSLHGRAEGGRLDRHARPGGCSRGERSTADVGRGVAGCAEAHAGRGPFSAKRNTMRSSPTFTASLSRSSAERGFPGFSGSVSDITGAYPSSVGSRSSGARDTVAAPRGYPRRTRLVPNLRRDPRTGRERRQRHHARAEIDRAGSVLKRHPTRAPPARGIRAHGRRHRGVRSAAELHGVQKRGGQREFHDDRRGGEGHARRVDLKLRTSAETEQVEDLVAGGGEDVGRVAVAGGGGGDDGGGDGGGSRGVVERRARGKGRGPRGCAARLARLGPPSSGVPERLADARGRARRREPRGGRRRRESQARTCPCCP